MSKLTNKFRKSPKQNNQSANHDNGSQIAFNQQNNYHIGASEIDALTRMQDKHPELVQDILSLRKTELINQDKIIAIEVTEQQLRISNAPKIATFAFIGQAMAFILSAGSLCAASFFAYNGQEVIAGLFLTSSIGVAFAQFYKKGDR
jgi:hypothetical protein